MLACPSLPVGYAARVTCRARFPLRVRAAVGFSLLALAGSLSAAEKSQPTVSTNAPAPHKHTNRLAQEKSPYLRQHMHNPVDWYPWGEAAFKKAREEAFQEEDG